MFKIFYQSSSFLLEFSKNFLTRSARLGQQGLGTNLLKNETVNETNEKLFEIKNPLKTLRRNFERTKPLKMTFFNQNKKKHQI